VQHLGLKVLEEGVHELVAVLDGLLAKGTADVADEADGDGAELVLFLRLEGGGEVRHKGGDVGMEVLLESYTTSGGQT
jgi:hypothetical protein